MGNSPLSPSSIDKYEMYPSMPQFKHKKSSLSILDFALSACYISLANGINLEKVCFILDIMQGECYTPQSHGNTWW
jgi:hypothetical protein